MSEREVALALFQSISGLSDAKCKEYLQRHNWKTEEALSEYFDAGLDPPENLAVNEEVAASLLSFYEENEPAAEAEQPMASLEFGDNRPRALLKSLNVLGKIMDRMAEISISFLFINTNPDVLQSTFRFRQARTSVTNLEVEIDDRILKSKIVDKQIANEKYQKKVQEGMGAVQLSSDDDQIGLFTAKIGNLLPNQNCKITITYISELALEKDKFFFALPVTTIPIQKSDQNDSVIDVQIDVEMNSAILEISSEFPIKKTQNHSHLSSITFQSDERLFNEFNFIIEIDKTIKQNGQTAVVEKYFAPAYYEKGEKLHGEREEIAISLLFQPDLSNYSDDERVICSEIIFLVDRSGSMAGSRMKQAKNALQLFLRSIPSEPHDVRFNIVSFGSKFESLFPRSVSYNEENFKYAKEKVNSNEFDSNLGGTDILTPLKFILESEKVNEEYPRQIICLTDGEVPNTIEVLQLIRKHQSNVRVFTLGVGADASKELVEGIAYEGRGRAEFVLSGQRVEPKVLIQLKRALQPALTHLHFEIENISKSDFDDYFRVTPSPLPPLFDGEFLQIFILTNFDHFGTLNATLKANFNDQNVNFDFPFSLNNAKEGHVIHQFTTSSLIRDLEIKAERGEEKAKKECVELSKVYSILSKFTSFITFDKREPNQNIFAQSIEQQEGESLFLSNNLNNINNNNNNNNNNVNINFLMMRGEVDDVFQQQGQQQQQQQQQERERRIPEPKFSKAEEKYDRNDRNFNNDNDNNFSYDDDNDDEEGECEGEFAEAISLSSQPIEENLYARFESPKMESLDENLANQGYSDFLDSFSNSSSQPSYQFSSQPSSQFSSQSSQPSFNSNNFSPSYGQMPISPSSFGGPPPPPPSSSPSPSPFPPPPGALSLPPPPPSSSSPSVSLPPLKPMVYPMMSSNSNIAPNKNLCGFSQSIPLSGGGGAERGIEKEERISSLYSESKKSSNARASSSGGIIGGIGALKSLSKPSAKSSSPKCDSKEKKKKVKVEKLSRKKSSNEVKEMEENRRESFVCASKSSCVVEEEEIDFDDDVNSRPLDKVVFLQKVNGSWSFSHNLSSLLSISFDVLKTPPSDVSVEAWCTLFAIEFIRHNFADLIDEWELLVTKAERWLNGAQKNWKDFQANVKALLQ